MKVTNRSDGRVVYTLPEYKQGTRRLFEIGESKELEAEELEMLFQLAGGLELIKDYLFVEDKAWVQEHWADVPLEYFWNSEEIKKCLLEDSLELFSETLDFAPDGILDIIKRQAWTIPLSDLNKIKIINDKLGFDVMTAVEIMSAKMHSPEENKPTQRLRKEA